MDHQIVKVSPDQLRFTQDSIADHFNLDGARQFLLEDALRDFGVGRLHASDFPAIAVARDEDGLLWSNDNRRLWLFRKAGVPQIEVKCYYRPLSRAPPPPHLRKLMAGKDYFPRVRWRDGWAPNIRMLTNPPLPSKVEEVSEKATPFHTASEKRREKNPLYVEPPTMAGSLEDYFSRRRTLQNPRRLPSNVEQAESEKVMAHNALAFLPSGGENVISSRQEKGTVQTSFRSQQVRQPAKSPSSSTNFTEKDWEDVAAAVVVVGVAALFLGLSKLFGR